MKLQMLIILAISCVLFFGKCSYENLDYVKEHGEDRWRELGYEPVAYEGYSWGLNPWFGYGGARVWWNLKRDDNGIMYTGYLVRWGDELHMYGPKAIDAIKP